MKFSFPDVYLDTSKLKSFKYEEFYHVVKLLDSSEDEFSYADLKEYWEKHISDIRCGLFSELLNMYVHIPFCIQKCFACDYYSVPVRDESAINHYLNYLVSVLDFFKDTFKSVKIKNFYIGGGTPSILSSDQLHMILDKIYSNYSFHEIGEKTFEVNPHAIDEEKIRILKKFNINRISFGVQSTNPNLLKFHNRSYQSLGDVSNLVTLIEKYGFPMCNADLIFGLKGQSVQDVLDSLKQLMEMGVQQITLYRINLSRPNSSQISRKLSNFAKNVLHYSQNLIDKYNYKLTSYSSFNDHAYSFFNNDKAEKMINLIDPKAFYDDNTIYPFSLFGIGPGIRCKIYSKLKYIFNRPEFSKKEIDESKFLEGKINMRSYDKEFFEFSPNKKVASVNYVSELHILLDIISREFLTKPDVDLNLMKKYYGEHLNYKIIKISELLGYSPSNEKIKVGNSNEEKWHFLLLFVQKYLELNK